MMRLQWSIKHAALLLGLVCLTTYANWGWTRNVRGDIVAQPAADVGGRVHRDAFSEELMSTGGRRLLQAQNPPARSPGTAPPAQTPTAPGPTPPATASPPVSSTPAPTTSTRAPSLAPAVTPAPASSLAPAVTPAPASSRPSPTTAAPVPGPPAATAPSPVVKTPPASPLLPPVSPPAGTEGPSPILSPPPVAPAPSSPNTPEPTTVAPTSPVNTPAPTPASTTSAPAPTTSSPMQTTSSAPLSAPDGTEGSNPTSPISSAPSPSTQPASLLVEGAPLPADAQGMPPSTSFTISPPSTNPPLEADFVQSPVAPTAAPESAELAGAPPIPARSQNGASPACLPACDPLVVQLRLLNTGFLTFQQTEFIDQFSAGLNVSSSQVLITSIGAGGSRQLTLTLMIMPPGLTFSPERVQAINSTLYSKQIRLDENLFGDYEVLSVQRYSETLPKPPPAPAPTPGVAPAPSPEPSLAPAPTVGGSGLVNSGGGSGGGVNLTVVVVAAVAGAAALVLLFACAGCILIRRQRKAPYYHQDIGKSGSSMGGPAALSYRGNRPMGPSDVMPNSAYPRANTARVFSYEELAEATGNWDPSNLLGEGGFGRVYKGLLKDGTPIAVKKLTLGGHQGDREFLVEVEMLSRLHHRHLVKLIGYYSRPEMQLLCYELVTNGSLEQHLHGTPPFKTSQSLTSASNPSPTGATSTPRPGSAAARVFTVPLDWDTRMKVAIGAARGLSYLHEDCQPCVIHRDFKASNILLEDNFHTKVADFGLAKQAPDGTSKDYLSTRVMGTFGYVAPEYAMTGHLLVKSDVYSYGVVLLELITGRKPVDMRAPPGQENLVTWARSLFNHRERLHELADPRLEGKFPMEDLIRVAAIAAACVQAEPVHRPSMGEVVQKLRALQRGVAESQYSGDSNALSEAAMQSGFYSSGEQPYPWTNGRTLQSALGTPNYGSESSQQFELSNSQQLAKANGSPYDSGPQLARDRVGGRPPLYRGSYDAAGAVWKENGGYMGDLSRSTVMSLAPDEGR